MTFQTNMTYFLLWNTKKLFFVHAMKLNRVQIVLDPIDFHCMGKKVILCQTEEIQRDLEWHKSE